MIPRSHRHLLVRGGTVVTMNAARDVVRADVLVTDGRIAAVGTDLDLPPAVRLLDADGMFLLPGLVQAHLHLGQTLFRGLAEDRVLLDWLRDRIWPLEAAHTEESAYWSSLLGAVECLRSGTTTVQDIGLVHGMEGVFRAVRDAGLRAVAGKCLMDGGEGVPPALAEDTTAALAGARELNRRWQGEARGRITTAYCPRFILSCSRPLWEAVAGAAAEDGLPVHTHLLEARDEEAAVRAALGRSQMEFLDETGVLDTDLRIAHGVWFGEEEDRVRAGRRLRVAHCPSANLKLASGVADLRFLRSRQRVSVGIGCDGAACNNRLDVLQELRLAALLQIHRHGPGAFTGRDALELATCEGARAVGLEREIGSVEPGKAGDILVLDLDRTAGPATDEASVYDRIVFGGGREAVVWVVVDGEVLVNRGRLDHLDEERVSARAAEELRALLARAELPA